MLINIKVSSKCKKSWHVPPRTKWAVSIYRFLLHVEV